VASETAHPGFDKACFYLGVELRKVPQKDMKCNMAGLRR